MIRLLVLCLLLTPLTAVAADSLLIDDFEHGLSPLWTVKSFKGETDYRVVEDGAGHALQADSHGTTSGLIFQQEFSLSDYQVISWRWKVEGVIAKGDAHTRAGDDYAARVYIFFPHWFYPKSKSLNYIWANKLEAGSIVPNPFTGNAMMIAVETGPAHAGVWQSVRRDIADDFRRAFGSEPPDEGIVAIMTDSDNTGSQVRAWYDDIRLEKASTPQR